MGRVIKDKLWWFLTKKTKEILTVIIAILITIIFWLLSMMVSYDSVNGWRLRPSMNFEDVKELKK